MLPWLQLRIGQVAVAAGLASSHSSESCSGWLCPFDRHEGAATFLAALIALIVAVAGAFRDMRVRSEDRKRDDELRAEDRKRDDELRAQDRRRDDDVRADESARRMRNVVRSLEFAVEILVMMRDKKVNSDGTPVSPSVANILAMLHSAESAVDHALSLPFVDQDLLDTAFNLMATIKALSSSLEMFERHKRPSAGHLERQFETLTADIDRARDTLERYYAADEETAPAAEGV